MELCIASLTLLIGILGFYLFHRKTKFFKFHRIPYISPVPLLGNMAPRILGTHHLSELLQKVYNIHPEAKYVGFYDFQTPVLVIRDLQLVKSIGIQNFSSFPDHSGSSDPKTDSLFNLGIFFLQGKKWRDTRNMLTPGFTSARMKMMFNIISGHVENFTNFLCEQSKKGGYVVNLNEIFKRLTADIIVDCAFGIQIDSLRHPDNELYVEGDKTTNFDDNQTLKFLIISNFKLLSRLLRIKLIPNNFERLFTEAISFTLKTRKEKGLTRPDLLQQLIDARDKMDKKLTLQEINGNAFAFFVGGLQTLSTALCFSAHECAVNPEVYFKLREEIDSVMRDCKGSPTYDAINDMPFLDAVVNESLRLYPTATQIDRVCRKSFDLPPTMPGAKPVTVTPGMRVWIPIFSIHRDCRYFEEPNKFIPERFLGVNKKKINPITIMPFGVGPRKCIAARLSVLVKKITLFHLLARCNLKVCSKTCVQIKLNPKSLVLQPQGDVSLEIEERSSDVISDREKKY